MVSEGGEGRERQYRGRRRANVDEGPRELRTVIKHTAEEYERVAALAAAQGISVPRLYTRALSSGDAVAAAHMQSVYAQVFAIRRSLALALSNINQMARAVNAGGELEVRQLTLARSFLEREAEKLERVLASLPGGERGGSVR